MELLPQTPPLLLLLLLSTEQRGATLTTDATGQSADAMLKTPSFLPSFLPFALARSVPFPLQWFCSRARGAARSNGNLVHPQSR